MKISVVRDTPSQLFLCGPDMIFFLMNVVMELHPITENKVPSKVVLADVKYYRAGETNPNFLNWGRYRFMTSEVFLNSNKIKADSKLLMLIHVRRGLFD